MIKQKALKLHKRLLALLLIVAIFLGMASSFAYEKPVQAAENRENRTITLVQAQKLAIKNSKSLEKLEIQLDAKIAARASALKSIAVKEHNLRTFRWSPLLSLKFPQSPNLSQLLDFNYKPVQIQYEIDKLEHRYNDTKLAEYEKVINLYIDIVVYERRIAFNEKRLEDMEATLKKNKVKLAAGEAAKTDVDSMEKAVKTLSKSLAADSRALISAKKKMSNILKLDVTTGYKFQDPFLEAEIGRELLPDITQYTLDRDDTYYDLCIDETAAKVSVEYNYRYLMNHYSTKYTTLIAPYIEAALAGNEFNNKAFYNNYKQFVNTVNEKWEGHIWIIFFRLKKEWFQGEIDGDRFIQDDPYGAYTATLDYKDAVEARVQGEQDLRDAIVDAFDNYVTIKSAYESYIEQVAEEEEGLEKARVLNSVGDLDYTEFKEKLDSYESLQNSLLDTMQQYSQTLISFDRLTCGGISAYLGDLIGDIGSVGGGESYVDPEIAEGAHYYIDPIIHEEQFELGVYFPENHEVEVTDFELWIDNVQVGDRKPVDQTIRHLTFDLNSVNRAFIRFYNGETFVDDVDIDPLASEGPLDIIKGYVPREDAEIGEYVLALNELRNQYTLTFNMNASEGIAAYRVKDANGSFLISNNRRPIDTPLTYLNTINASMGDLVFEFFDESGVKLCEGYANTTLMKIYKKTEE